MAHPNQLSFDLPGGKTDEVIIGRDRYAQPPAPKPHQTPWRMPEDFPDLAGHGEIAVDIETKDIDLKTRGPGAQRGGKICGVAIGTSRGLRRYYPVDHLGWPNMDKAKVFDWLSVQLNREGQPKIGANLKYDLDFLTEAKIKHAGPYWDVQVAEPLLDENQLSYTLESIAQRRLGEGKRDDAMTAWLTQAFGSKNIKQYIYRAPPSVVGPYAESDVDLPLRIFALQRKELEAQGLWDLFLLESKLIPIFVAMRARRGVPVDLDRAEQLRQVVIQRQKDAEDKIRHITGIEPRIWAADSLERIFDHVGISYPITEKTEVGSFKKAWLASVDHPVGRLVVEARTMDKFRSTFLEGYILSGHNNHRIQCEFHQLRGEGGGAVSGRFSSSHPNLQNIPIRDPDLGPLIRSIFGPEEGELWWKIDWSQIEFRLAVHYAALMKLHGVQRVVDQYHTDPTTDYHRVTADLTGLSRANAKAINFGIIYGLGTPKLCTQLGITRAQGDSLLYQYHSKLPFIRPLYYAAMNRAKDKGEIVTLLGRKRRFKLEFGERQFTHAALNAALQGSAADIMKKSMVDISESGVMDVLGAPYLTVHDELDGSLPQTPAGTEALAEVRHIMETCVPLAIPLVADQTIAGSWGGTK